MVLCSREIRKRLTAPLTVYLTRVRWSQAFQLYADLRVSRTIGGTLAQVMTQWSKSSDVHHTGKSRAFSSRPGSIQTPAAPASGRNQDGTFSLRPICAKTCLVPSQLVGAAVSRCTAPFPPRGVTIPFAATRATLEKLRLDLCECPPMMHYAKGAVNASITRRRILQSRQKDWLRHVIDSKRFSPRVGHFSDSRAPGHSGELQHPQKTRRFWWNNGGLCDFLPLPWVLPLICAIRAG